MKDSGLNFLGIGAQKSGTTWLYHMLSRHPDVFMPAQKELHFWDTEETTPAAIESYAAQFEVAGAVARGEITPAYGQLDPLVIRLIHARFPGAKLLYILRNPVDRAWSHAKMHVLQYMAKGRKVDGVAVDIETMPDRWFIEHFHSAKSLRRGDYESCIRNWRSIYPEEQLRIMLYDDLVGDPRSVLGASCTHIGVDVARIDGVSDAELSRKLGATGHEAIRPALLPVLLEIYRPQVERLSGYLGLDLTGMWLRRRGWA